MSWAHLLSLQSYQTNFIPPPDQCNGFLTALFNYTSGFSKPFPQRAIRVISTYLGIWETPTLSPWPMGKSYHDREGRMDVTLKRGGGLVSPLRMSRIQEGWSQSSLHLDHHSGPCKNILQHILHSYLRPTDDNVYLYNPNTYRVTLILLISVKI